MYSKLFIFLISFAQVTHGNWGYMHQQDWPDTCTSSHSQSPISLEQQPAMPVRGDIEMHYVPVPLKIEDDGHGVRIRLDKSGHLKVPNIKNRFYLKEAVFHTPSEHWIGMSRFQMEVQLIHQSTTGNFLNVAVLCDFEEHATSHFLDEFIAPFIDLQGQPGPYPKTFSPPASEHWRIDMADFFDTAMRGLEEYYNYEGSLTQPPCTENVQWIVSANRCLASKQWGIVMNQFDSMHNNARGLEPQNGRTVQLQTTSNSFIPSNTSHPTIFPTNAPVGTFSPDGGRSGEGDDGESKVGALLPIMLIILCCCCCGLMALFKTHEDNRKKDYQKFEDDDSIRLSHRNQTPYPHHEEVGGGSHSYLNHYDDEMGSHRKSFNNGHANRYLNASGSHTYRGSPSPISRPLRNHSSPISHRTPTHRTPSNHSQDSIPLPHYTTPSQSHQHTSKHSSNYTPRSGFSSPGTNSSGGSGATTDSYRPDQRDVYQKQTRPTHERNLTGESLAIDPHLSKIPMSKPYRKQSRPSFRADPDVYRGPQYRQFSHERYALHE